MIRKQVFGFEFISGDLQEVLSGIINRNEWDNTHKPFLITPNADQVLRFNKEFHDLMTFYKDSAFILPDGMPIVVFSRLIGQKLQKRLPGSDLFPLLWRYCISADKKILVVAPNEETATGLLKEMKNGRAYIPGKISIDDNKQFEFEAGNICEMLVNEKFDYLVIGLGFPKQEILGKMIYGKIKSEGTSVPLICLLGASFEFYLNIKRRAPRLFQRLGLEWLHRLLSEPKRLWKRYTIGNIKFLMFFTVEYFKSVNFKRR
jgi:N-acetylglucosaminyldiphosphoundecaprenol N-acetyl-beta-D-mannosaminyltransferase